MARQRQTNSYSAMRWTPMTLVVKNHRQQGCDERVIRIPVIMAKAVPNRIRYQKFLEGSLRSVTLFASETSVAGLIGLKGAEEMAGRKIRPLGRIGVYLGVKTLPQQKVRKPLFATCSDEEVGVW